MARSKTKSEQIWDLRNSGLSGREIADRVGCNPGLVSGVLKYGVEGRSKRTAEQCRARDRRLGIVRRKQLDSSIKKRVIDAVKSGNSFEQAAHMIGLTEGSVAGIIYRAGTAKKIRELT